MFSLEKNIYQQHGLVLLIQGNHFGLLCSAPIKNVKYFVGYVKTKLASSEKYLNVVVVVVMVVVVIVVVVVVVLLLFCWREDGL